jgi:hypothetical protein
MSLRVPEPAGRLSRGVGKGWITADIEALGHCVARVHLRTDAALPTTNIETPEARDDS